MEDRRTGSSRVSGAPGDDFSDDVVDPEVLEIDNDEQLARAEEEAREVPAPDEDSIAAQIRRNRPVRKSAVAKKDAPTPSRRGRKPAAEKRTTPAQFVGQSVEELKKVVWPTGQQVNQYFWVVLVFVLFIMAYVVALDTGFGALLLKLFG